RYVSSEKSWWPGVSSRLITQSRYSICMTDEATEMPRCFSISIQSEAAWREALRALTLPAIWMAPANSRSFSVSVVLPASGCEMMANVRRRATSWGIFISADFTFAGSVWTAQPEAHQFGAAAHGKLAEHRHDVLVGGGGSQTELAGD